MYTNEEILCIRDEPPSKKGFTMLLLAVESAIFTEFINEPIFLSMSTVPLKLLDQILFFIHGI